MQSFFYPGKTDKYLQNDRCARWRMFLVNKETESDNIDIW